MTSSVAAPHDDGAERANQRNAVLAGFLGWTLDAFDFFILTLVIDDIAKSFGRSRPDIAFTLTVALATRPLGAIIFGIMADRLGRRLPLMINVIFYAVISVLSGLAPSYQVVPAPADAVRHRDGRRVGRRRVAGARIGVAAAARAALGPAAGRLRARQPARGARVPRWSTRTFNALVSGQRLAPDVLPRRPAGAAVALHPRQGEGVRGVARAQDRLDELPPFAAGSTGSASSTSSC